MSAPEGMHGDLPVYVVRRLATPIGVEPAWDLPEWEEAEGAELGSFRPEGSSHRPRTAARLLYDPAGIYGLFRVEDRFVRSVHTRPGEPVYEDSCVEFFVQPVPGRGYFNFEFNAGGALLASHVLDPTRTPEGFRSFTPLSEAAASRVRVRSSLPPVIDPERPDPLTWTLAFFIPFELLGRYAGSSPPRAGSEWRGNFYKCADRTSHPHWASWSPVSERNFHLPGCFGVLRFG